MIAAPRETAAAVSSQEVSMAKIAGINNFEEANGWSMRTFKTLYTHINK